MSDWDTIKSRVVELLGDSDGSRYSDAVLEQAALQAIRMYTGVLPQIKSLLIEISTETDEITLEDAVGLVAVISVCWSSLGTEPVSTNSTAFTWSWADGIPYIRFPGMVCGTLRVIFSASHTLAGLCEETVTTVPDVHHSLLAWVTAGYALQSRAESIREAYGQKSSEAVSMQQSAEKMLLHSQQQLDSLRYNQSISPEWGSRGWELEALVGEE